MGRKFALYRAEGTPIPGHRAKQVSFLAKDDDHAFNKARHHFTVLSDLRTMDRTNEERQKFPHIAYPPSLASANETFLSIIATEQEVLGRMHPWLARKISMQQTRNDWENLVAAGQAYAMGVCMEDGSMMPGAHCRCHVFSAMDKDWEVAKATLITHVKEAHPDKATDAGLVA